MLQWYVYFGIWHLQISACKCHSCCPLLFVTSDICFGIFSSSSLSDAPPLEKKYKPLNTTPNSTKEIKVKLIPPQRKHT